ncbi:MAG: DMT family transporter [Clostridiales bacterium]|jgi:drug/metabolite transporter (DMT)-like permease|nr:DMT family transporter [Clostridiales bacterium]
METYNRKLGHLAASFCIIVWSTTYVSTKILLEDFTPTEILVFRFIIAYILLFILSPKPMIPDSKKEELIFIAAGFSGVLIYFLFQNIGLTYTLASNAGVLVSVAPMFTAIISHFMKDGQKLSRPFVIGFIIAIIGISFISFNGSFILKLNPIGDILLLIAALSWAVFSNLLTLVNNGKYTIVQSTRKVFFYGLIFMIPTSLLMDFEFTLTRFIEPFKLTKLLSSNIFNILFLGLLASGICFVTWNYAVKTLGSVKTSTYIYLSPIVTIIFSVITLGEPITWASISGTALILIGLTISERKRNDMD